MYPLPGFLPTRSEATWQVQKNDERAPSRHRHLHPLSLGRTAEQATHKTHPDHEHEPAARQVEQAIMRELEPHRMVSLHDRQQVAADHVHGELAHRQGRRVYHNEPPAAHIKANVILSSIIKIRNDCSTNDSRSNRHVYVIRL